MVGEVWEFDVLGSWEVRELAPDLSHLMYVLKSKFVTALIPLYSIAAMS